MKTARWRDYRSSRKSPSDNDQERTLVVEEINLIKICQSGHIAAFELLLKKYEHKAMLYLPINCCIYSFLNMRRHEHVNCHNQCTRQLIGGVRSKPPEIVRRVWIIMNVKLYLYVNALSSLGSRMDLIACSALILDDW